MTGPAPLGWSEIYERLARRPDRPDPQAWAALEQRIRAWTSDDDLAAATCSEVWRTFNLTRGGAAFEGFVHGRFIELAGAGAEPADPRDSLPAVPLPHMRERGDPLDGAGSGISARAERLAACLEALRGRNPRHHAALILLYEDRATVPEAADALAVDTWTVRILAARARLALAQNLASADRKKQARTARAPGQDGRRTPRDRGRVPPRRRPR